MTLFERGFMTDPGGNASVAPLLDVPFAHVISKPRSGILASMSGPR